MSLYNNIYFIILSYIILSYFILQCHQDPDLLRRLERPAAGHRRAEREEVH